MTASFFCPLPSAGEMVSWSRELQAHPDGDQIPRLSQASEVALTGERWLYPDSRAGYAGELQVCAPHPALEIKLAAESRRRLSCGRDVRSPSFLPFFAPVRWAAWDSRTGGWFQRLRGAPSSNTFMAEKRWWEAGVKARGSFESIRSLQKGKRVAGMGEGIMYPLYRAPLRSNKHLVLPTR